MPTLTFNPSAITDGQFIKRDGDNFVGAAAGSGSQTPWTQDIVSDGYVIQDDNSMISIDPTNRQLYKPTYEFDSNISVGTNSNGIEITGTKAYVVNTGSNNISVIDTTTDTVASTITVGTTPAYIVITGTKAYVANQWSNSVSVIDTTTDTVTATIAVGTNPIQIAIAGTKAYVACYGSNSVSVIDTTTDTVTSTISVGTTPIFIATTGTKAYVANSGVDESVSVIDTTTDTVTSTITIGIPGVTYIAIAGNKAYVSNNTNVSVISTITDTILTTITVGTYPGFIAISGNKAYVLNQWSNDVSVIDTTTDIVSATIPVGNYPRHIVFTGSYAFVANYSGGGSVSIINTNVNVVLKTIYEVGNTSVHLAVINSNKIYNLTYGGGVDVITLTANSSVLDWSNESINGVIIDGDIKNLNQIIDADNKISIDAYHKNLRGYLTKTITVGESPFHIVANNGKSYVMNTAGNSVSVIDIGDDTVTSTITVGSAPYYMVAIGSKAYITNSGSNSVSVVNTNNDTVTATIPVGTTPRYAAISGIKAYIVNGNSNNVSVIDTTTDTVVATISVGTEPAFILATSTRVYVINPQDDTVSVIDTTSDTVIATVTVGNTPEHMAIVGSKLYVTNINDANISVIDTDDNSIITTISVGNLPYQIAISGTKAYVANLSSNTVSVIDTTTDAAFVAIPVGSNPRSIAIIGSKAYVVNNVSENVSVIDTIKDTVVSTIKIGSNPQMITICGEKAYITSYGVGVFSVTSINLNAKTVDWSDGVKINNVAMPMPTSADNGKILSYNSFTTSYVMKNDSRQTPYFIDTGETFTVEENCQVLFKLPITVDGTLTVDGYLIEISNGKQVVSLTDAATITVDSDICDVGTVTITDNRTMGNPTGSPSDGKYLKFRIRQDGAGGRTITWDTQYRFGDDFPVPTLTPDANKTDYIGFIYNELDDTWDCVSIAKGY